VCEPSTVEELFDHGTKTLKEFDGAPGATPRYDRMYRGKTCAQECAEYSAIQAPNKAAFQSTDITRHSCAVPSPLGPRRQYGLHRL
jgi:hypothetical protein